MEQNYFDFYNINENGSETINYDLPEMPVYIRDGNLSSLKNYTFKAHFHSDWEFITVLEGSMNYSINGEIITLTEGESLFVNCNQIHFGFSAVKEECRYICLIVHPVLFCNNPYIERHYIAPICNSGYTYLTVDSQAFSEVVRRIYRKKEMNAENLYLNILQDLFSMVNQLFSLLKALPIKQKRRQSFVTIKTMLDYIANHYYDRVTLNDLADSANICSNSCINLFKRYTNMTPMDYLTNYRIEKACGFLKSTDKTVSEIAYDCGFSTSSYFAVIFKRLVGITPKEYRSLYYDR
ncbi:MAG: AraC family transcriptional regulator [Eubacterium sp.]|nr:AraC family transcriptional regulator [Eubacterium sp.]